MEDSDEEEISKNKTTVMTEDVRDLYREIKKEFLNYLNSEKIPLLVLFKRLDIENDDFISFVEFQKSL